MKILVLGNDGYIGYPLTLHLLKRGYEVFGVDNFFRRDRVHEVGGSSLTPILSPLGRRGYLRHNYKNFIDQVNIHLGYDGPEYIKSVLSSFKPDCIIHLAEQPSAPWSMRNVGFARATQHENVIGTLDLLWAMKEECPDAHLIKLGSMGEYGTPECDIPEGVVPKMCIKGFVPVPVLLDGMAEIQMHCPMQDLLFPRTPNSFYHLSKVHDTHNIHFACRNWGLTSTDIMQGIVFGLGYEETDMPDEELTRFDYDEYFGTVLNRFCAQAIINYPLTIYGSGSQQRGLLPLQDSINCLILAIENPPSKGEYRTFNQFENVYSITELANRVREAASLLGLTVDINHLDNPRKESESHYYNPTHQRLFDLGYKPTENTQGEITTLIRRLLPYKDKVIEKVIVPKTNWR